eukprot:TRINITY_DN4134_c0_g2_i1.p1 TRINITY_DN4134_c0_g2~~TRINITY_DN4134_c0_g2_i1.p1  ORF type:complete len:512 (-),score=77.74 TRINITY_DN4134_c0_g2_i1:261-1796(-)
MSKADKKYQVKCHFTDAEIEVFVDYRITRIAKQFKVQTRKEGNLVIFSSDTIAPLISKEFMNYIRILTRPPQRLRLRSAVVNHYSAIQLLVRLEEAYGIIIVHDQTKQAISFAGDLSNWNLFNEDIDGILSFEWEYYSKSQSRWIGLPHYIQATIRKSFKTREYFEIETDEDIFLQADLVNMTITDHSGRLKSIRLVIDVLSRTLSAREERAPLFHSPNLFLQSLTSDQLQDQMEAVDQEQVDHDLAQSMAKYIPLLHVEEIEQEQQHRSKPADAAAHSRIGRVDERLRVPIDPNRSISPVGRTGRSGSVSYEFPRGRSGSAFSYSSMFRAGGESAVHVTRPREWNLFLHFPGLQRQPLRGVVLMGSSIAIAYGKQEKYDLDGIYYAWKYFSSNGIDVSVTVPQYRTKSSSAAQRPPTRDTQNVIDTLRRAEALIEVPVGFDESLAAIEIARVRDAVLITNEKIACENYPELAQYKFSMVFPFTFDEHILLVARQVNKTYWFETAMVRKST